MPEGGLPTPDNQHVPERDCPPQANNACRRGLQTRGTARQAERTVSPNRVYVSEDTSSKRDCQPQLSIRFGGNRVIRAGEDFWH